MDLMKFDNTNSLVVLDDQSNSKKFNSFQNIETVNPRIESYFPIRGTVEIGLGKKKFNILKMIFPNYKTSNFVRLFFLWKGYIYLKRYKKYLQNVRHV